MSNFIKYDSKDAEFSRIPLALSCCYFFDGIKYFVADENITITLNMTVLLTKNGNVLENIK